MNVSDLITRLEQVLADHGDIPVTIVDRANEEAAELYGTAVLDGRIPDGPDYSQPENRPNGWYLLLHDFY